MAQLKEKPDISFISDQIFIWGIMKKKLIYTEDGGIFREM